VSEQTDKEEEEDITANDELPCLFLPPALKGGGHRYHKTSSRSSLSLASIYRKAREISFDPFAKAPPCSAARQKPSTIWDNHAYLFGISNFCPCYEGHLCVVVYMVLLKSCSTVQP